MHGRFFLGVGTGENLNEHILGDRWPETEIRQERLTEAIEDSIPCRTFCRPCSSRWAASAARSRPVGLATE
jgi:hypothetical protein